MPAHKASELFEECFRDNVGTLTATCELCGLTIFCTGDIGPYETGELDRLKKMAKDDPTKCEEWAGLDGVSLGQIAGQQFILGHDCPKLGQYERFIWENRFAIAEYLQKRAKEELDAKTKQADKLGALKDVKFTEDEDIHRPGPEDLRPTP